MKTRRPAHFTQWAAQFAVASELCKRKYEVALTMGNNPRADLVVISPARAKFIIDVKGLYKKNFWAVREQAADKDLYYIFAFVPEGELNRYFILTQEQVNQEVRRVIQAARDRSIAKGGQGEKADRFPGAEWKVVEAYENRWDQLPS